jgi:hypothetical protein
MKPGITGTTFHVRKLSIMRFYCVPVEPRGWWMEGCWRVNGGTVWKAYIQTFRSCRVEAGVGILMQESQVVKPNLDADLYNQTRRFEATSYIHW